MKLDLERKERILSLYEQRKTQKQICDITGYNKSTVSYYCGRRYLSDCEKRYEREREREEMIRKAVPLCKNIHQVCKFIGVRPITNNQRLIKELIERLSLDISHFEHFDEQDSHKKRIPYSLDDIFCEHSSYTTSSRLKTILLKNGIKEHVCEMCHNTEWMGHPISLQTHHINGIHDDNRISNLQLLCPNCHSMTENYCGKNIRNSEKDNQYGLKTHKISVCPVCGKKFYNKGGSKYCSYKCYLTDKKTVYAKYTNNITRDVLVDLFKKGETFSSIGRIYNVSYNTVRKWCNSFNIPSTKKEMIEYINKFDDVA